MNDTVKAAPVNEPTLTLDDLVALSLSARELDTIAAYQSFCGGSILCWAAKMGRGRS